MCENDGKRRGGEGEVAEATFAAAASAGAWLTDERRV